MNEGGKMADETTVADGAVITTVILTAEQAQWLLNLGAALYPPRNPLARPSLSRTLRAVLDWARRQNPDLSSIARSGSDEVPG
jgi:hypothetical protein